MKFFDFVSGPHSGVVREISEPDLVAIVAYWHESPLAYLESMGADPRKLSSRAETEARFRSALPGAPSPRRHVAISIDLGSRLVAYTNAYVDPELKGHAHVHVLDPSLRHQGLGTTLFLRVLMVYLEHYGLSGLVMQTHPDSKGINRLLQSFGLRPQLIDDQEPSGMARPGPCNLYEIGQDGLRSIAARMAGSPGSRRE
jgi:RimJ/RimL family protein N-acetyltransferase